MIDVVYLAYANEELGYGLDVVEEFINSYRSHPAGIEHNLIIIAKNWTDSSLYEKLCSLAKGNNAKILDLPDDGFDIGAYFRAARCLDSDYVYFIGSNVQIVSDNWLLYSYNAFESDENIQLIGAMGSYESGLSGVFPNPHIRTNAFMLKRELFIKYAAIQKFPKTKEDTWRLEHCSNSISAFIIGKGYKMAIVDSDGKIYTPEKWPISQTYAYPESSKLMMTDKWARRYLSADEILQRKIEQVVWGKCFKKFPQNIIKEVASKVNIFVPYAELASVFSSEVFRPIFAGKINSVIETDALQDNAGINISDKFNAYGDLTAYYWLLNNHLKTTDVPYVGFVQPNMFLDFNIDGKNMRPFNPIFITNFIESYNKYTEENILNCIEDSDVLLTEKALFNVTAYDAWLKTYNKNDFDIAINLINELYPEYRAAFEDVLSGNFIYPFGCFVMKRELLIEFLEWLFDVLAELEKRINWTSYGKYSDMLSSAFISERFFNIWLVHNLKNKDLKIKSTTSFMVYFDFEVYVQKSMEELKRLKEQIGL